MANDIMDRRSLLNCDAFRRSSASMGAGYFTNAVLRTHHDKPVGFYDDLIKDKLVVIHFMYAKCRGICPTSTATLVKVQHALGKRVGKDVFMYSITLKPQEDSPAALKEYAQMHGVKPGWLFLTGSEYDITTLRFRLFSWDHPAVDFDLDQHTGMVRIINDPLNRWTMCPTSAKPSQIVDAISWVEPTKSLALRFRDNRLAQAKIDREALEAKLAKAAHHG